MFCITNNDLMQKCELCKQKEFILLVNEEGSHMAIKRNGKFEGKLERENMWYPFTGSSKFVGLQRESLSK